MATHIINPWRGVFLVVPVETILVAVKQTDPYNLKVINQLLSNLLVAAIVEVLALIKQNLNTNE